MEFLSNKGTQKKQLTNTFVYKYAHTSCERLHRIAWNPQNGCGEAHLECDLDSHGKLGMGYGGPHLECDLVLGNREWVVEGLIYSMTWTFLGSREWAVEGLIWSVT